MIGNNTDDDVIPQPMRKKRHNGNGTPGREFAIHERPPLKGFLRTYLRGQFDTGVGTDGWAA